MSFRMSAGIACPEDSYCSDVEMILISLWRIIGGVSVLEECAELAERPLIPHDERILKRQGSRAGEKLFTRSAASKSFIAALSFGSASDSGKHQRSVPLLKAWK